MSPTNHSFTIRTALGALAAISVFTLTACDSKSSPPVKPVVPSVPAPTVPSPTETPTAAPTPAPTPPSGATAPPAKPAPTPPPSATASPVKSPPAIPASLVETKALPIAPGLGEVMKSAKVGDKVTFAARIQGRADPFVASRAIMVVSDPKLKPCNEIPGDTCSTPADLCCESAETMKANVGTVQVADAAGKPIPVTLSGHQGLKALAFVVVEGVVVERGDEGGFVVNATHVILKPAS